MRWRARSRALPRPARPRCRRASHFAPGERDRGVQQLGPRSVELPLKAIAIHATLVPEVVALVYRPWHLAAVELDGERFELLVDGGAAAVEGEAPAFDFAPRPLADLQGEAPALAPSRCPECGADPPFAPAAAAPP